MRLKDGREQAQGLFRAQETFVTSLDGGSCYQQQHHHHHHHHHPIFLVASIYLTFIHPSVSTFFPFRVIHFLAVFTRKQLDLGAAGLTVK
jgi:hypothetical protein